MGRGGKPLPILHDIGETMRYEGTVYRPPSEAESLIIQATIGCPHNRCRFCNMYKDKKFRIRKTEDILADLELAAAYYEPRAVRSLFLADGNTTIMKTPDLVRILRRSYELFPYLTRITSYGASRYHKLKSLDEWKEMRAAGLSRIHCGMETGHQPLLDLSGKGTTAEDHIAFGKLVRGSGMELSMYYLTGMGGMAMWEGHARDSAAVLNAVNPEFIRIRTFNPVAGTPMGDSFLSGESTLLEPHDALRELRLLVENLDVDGSKFFSDHWLNFANIQGVLPRDKDKMLAEIDHALAKPRSAFREVGGMWSGML